VLASSLAPADAGADAKPIASLKATPKFVQTTIAKILPDLTGSIEVRLPQAQPETLKDGQQIVYTLGSPSTVPTYTAKVTIMNLGAAAAGSSKAKIYVITNGKLQNPGSVEVSVPALAPGGSPHVVEFPGKLDLKSAKYSPNKIEVHINLNPPPGIKESTRTNNKASVKGRVKVAFPKP
jgi:hypothetical protein